MQNRQRYNCFRWGKPGSPWRRWTYTGQFWRGCGVHKWNIISFSIRGRSRQIWLAEFIMSWYRIMVLYRWNDYRLLLFIIISYSGFMRFQEAGRFRCSHGMDYDTHLDIFIAHSKTDQMRQGKHVIFGGRWHTIMSGGLHHGILSVGCNRGGWWLLHLPECVLW